MPKKPAVPLISLDQVQPEQVKWLWPGRIPLGKVTILQGDPGLGKSTLALEIASLATRNLPMPDGSLSALSEPAAVLLMSGEDGLADTIRPRLDAVGAEQRLISVPENQLLVPKDADLIRDAVKQTNAKLVIIDPLAAFLDGSVNSWNNQHVRRALSPLARIADLTGAAILVLDHLNKRGGVAAIQRGSGSIAFNAAARSVLLVGKHPQESGAFVLANVKSNLAAPAPSLAYKTVESRNKAVMLEWLQGECPYDADDLVMAVSGPAKSRKLSEAAEFLLGQIPPGTSKLGRVVEAEAQSRGISDKTLARARKELGVHCQPIAFGKEWTWTMPLSRIGNREHSTLGQAFPELATENVG